MGYIPRLPNAFMLFRADFVRQEHVPGSINAGEKGEEFAAAVRDLDTVPFRSIRQSRVTPIFFDPGFNFFSICPIF